MNRLPELARVYGVVLALALLVIGVTSIDPELPRLPKPDQHPESVGARRNHGGRHDLRDHHRWFRPSIGDSTRSVRPPPRDSDATTPPSWRS